MAYVYQSLGAEEIPGLTEKERELAKSDPALLDFEFRKRDLSIRREELKAAKSSAFWDGLQALVVVALPIAAWLGVEKALGLSRVRKVS